MDHNDFVSAGTKKFSESMLLLLSCTALSAVATMAPVNLRAEYLANPLGIDTAKPRLSWQIESTARNEVQQSAQIIVASSKANIDANSGDMWSTTIHSSQSVNVEYAGTPLSSAKQYYWKVKVVGRQEISGWSGPAQFATGMLNASDWAANWIGMASAGDHDCPWFRKTFTLSQIPDEALVFIGSIGYHELYVNGNKASDAVLTPSVSDLQKRVLYNTYDIKRFLQPGNNVIAVWLAPGWSLFRGVNPGLDFYTDKKPVFIGKVVLSPGNAMKTDNTWKCARSCTVHLGAWTNNNFGGDQIDARNNVPDWNSTALNDNGWENATVYAVNRTLSADLAPPNRLVDTILPASVTSLGANKYRVKMNKLFTGWIEVALKSGTPGSTITIMAASQSFDGATTECNQLDKFIYDTNGQQGMFCNRFSYHEIGYIVISGISYAPALQDIRGYRVGNDLNYRGAFTCSNALLKKIYDANLNTFVNLTTGGMTVDCPHRERLGYGDVAQGCMEAALSNYEMGAFYTKLVQDWRDTQYPSGYIHHTAPTIDGGGGPAWSGSIIAIPWEVYCTYGDKRILEKTYDEIRKWLAWLDTKDDANSLLKPTGCDNGGYMCFLGDWITPQGSEDDPSPEALLFNNCYYLYVMRIMSKIAAVLGNAADAARYSSKATAISSALNARFFNAAGSYYLDTRQGHLVMPLLSNAVPTASIGNVMRNLQTAIVVTQNGHLDVGDPVIYYMTKLLTETDRSDLVFTYANQTTYPGYGNFIRQGYTTWPESWGGGGSIMHGCYPGIGAWFQEGLSGIRFDTAAPGFQHFIVKPSKVGDVTSATARVPSMYGIIESNWTSKDSSLTLQAAIPGNTSATVYLPALGFGATNVIIQEGGIIIYDKGQQKGPVGGVSLKDTSANCIALDVGSGIYNFRVSHKNATGAINREAQTIMVNRVSLENGVLDIALNVRKAQRQIIHMSIFNCKGALVKSIAAKTGVEETQHISLDVSDLPKGVFCMSVESKGGRMIIRRFSIAKQI